MQLREYFEYVETAAKHIQTLKDEEERLRYRAMFKGSGDGIGGSGYLDPMRNVDDFIDWQKTAAEEIRADLRVIDDAKLILTSIERSNGVRVAAVLRERYIELIPTNEIAKKNGIKPKSLENAMSLVFEQLDKIGLARLKELGD